MPIPGQEPQAPSTNEVAKTSQQTAEPQESTQTSHEANADDGWGAAKEAFYEGTDLEGHDFEDDSYQGEGQGEAVSGEDDSHVEADQTDDPDSQQEDESGQETEFNGTELDLKYTLDDLAVPHKYKDLVKNKIDTILGDAKNQSSKLSEGYQQSNAAFARAFVEIIRSDDPMSTLREYAEEVVPALNLPDTLLKNITNKNQPKREAPTANGNQTPNANGGNGNNFQAHLTNGLKKIHDKYWPALEASDDPAKGREIYAAMDREKLALIDSVNNAKMKTVLTAFYEKLIKPQQDEYSVIKKDVETKKAVADRNAKVSHWNSADQEMAKQNSDWPKYKAKVKELLKSDYKQMLNATNQSGKGHLKLMRDIYLLVSRKDHLESAKRPVRGVGGLKNTNKHIKTQKAGGSGWDDIKSNLWGDIIPEE